MLCVAKTMKNNDDYYPTISRIKIKLIIKIMKNSYRKIAQILVKYLPNNDYPVFNTTLWVET